MGFGNVFSCPVLEVEACRTMACVPVRPYSYSSRVEAKALLSLGRRAPHHRIPPPGLGLGPPDPQTGSLGYVLGSQKGDEALPNPILGVGVWGSYCSWYNTCMTFIPKTKESWWYSIRWGMQDLYHQRYDNALVHAAAGAQETPHTSRSRQSGQGDSGVLSLLEGSESISVSCTYGPESKLLTMGLYRDCICASLSGYQA